MIPEFRDTLLVPKITKCGDLLYTLATHYKIGVLDKHKSVATQHQPREHCINDIIVPRNINILSHTITGTSLHPSSHAYHQRISRPQHIMAQSADSNPTPCQWAAPAQHATSPGNAVHEPPHSNPAVDATIHQASGPEISSITSPTLDSTSPVARGTTTGFSPEDEENVWLAAMTMTFDNFYQGIPEDDKPPSSMDTEANKRVGQR